MPQVALVSELTMCFVGPSIVASSTQDFITINGIPVVIQGSPIVFHKDEKHDHYSVVASCGQNYVFIKGKAVAQIGSMISCTGSLITDDKGKARQNFIFIT